MSLELAPRPFNEEIRAKTVISTGLIDSPEPELFQIYSDLAKDVSGFDKASFSLYDLDFQCPISSTGYEEDRNGQKYARDSLNVCSYVILDSEPLLIGDMSKHPTWKSHPRILDGSGTLGYAGFPVINKDNYALGTLCMLNKTPKSLDTNQVDLLKKITANIALLLDLRIEQKEITSEKILNSLINFRKYDCYINFKSSGESDKVRTNTDSSTNARGFTTTKIKTHNVGINSHSNSSHIFFQISSCSIFFCSFSMGK